MLQPTPRMPSFPYRQSPALVSFGSLLRLRYSATFSIEETSLQIPLPLPRGKATRTVLDVRYCTNPSASTQYLRTQCSPSLSEAPLRSQAANRRRIRGRGTFAW